MNAQTPILDFQIAVVEPGRLSHVSRKEREHCRTAICRFGKFLKREAILSDFSMATVYAFADSMADGTAPRQVRRIIERLKMTWRAAVKRGLCTWEPERRSHRPYRKVTPPKPKAPTWEDATPPAGSVREFFEGYYRPLRLRGKSPNTVRLYGFTVRNFGRFLGREPMMDDLTDDTVSRLLSWIVERGKSPYTAEKERCQLLAIWRFAARKRFVDREPDVMPEKCPIRIPAGWTDDELARLWAAIDQTAGKVAGVPAALWWKVLHIALLFTAERISAVMQLRWDDFDSNTGWIIARAEYRKGGRSDKSTRLPPAAVAALESIRQPKRDLIFPWDRAPTSIYHAYERILKRAGLPHDGKSKFHRMRKSAASHFEAKGGNATALLGHSSRKVTLSYLDPRIVTETQAADLLCMPGT